jgi:hypothetical protein
VSTVFGVAGGFVGVCLVAAADYSVYFADGISGFHAGQTISCSQNMDI